MITYESRPLMPKSMLTVHEEYDHRYVDCNISLMAAFPRAHGNQPKPFAFTAELTAYEEKYFEKFVHAHDKVIELIEYYENRWQFPIQIIEEARALSCELMYVLQAQHNPRMHRKLASGRLDVSRMPEVIRDISLRRFDAERLRPFKRRLKGAPSRPSVGIVIQGNPEFMWMDSQNIPNAARAGLAIAWAAEALDCKAEVYITETHEEKMYEKAQHKLIQVISVDEITPIHSLGILFHRDLFRCGESIIYTHHPDAYKLRSPSYGADGNYSAVACKKSVYAMRKYHKCDIVIAIGSHGDADKADVHHPKAINPKELISQTAMLLSKKLELKGIAA